MPDTEKELLQSIILHIQRNREKKDLGYSTLTSEQKQAYDAVELNDERRRAIHTLGEYLWKTCGSTETPQGAEIMFKQEFQLALERFANEFVDPAKDAILHQMADILDDMSAGNKNLESADVIALREQAHQVYQLLNGIRHD